VIAFRDVGFRYPDAATATLAGITLEVPAGSVVAVVGRSGVGKSTLLRLACGLVEPDSGRLDGGPCALLPQHDALMPWRSALANATVVARLEGAGAGEAEDRARALFLRFGLAGFEAARPRELSGGMRRRVALLRTVLSRRPTLLLDEPFGGLDAITRADLAGWLGELLAGVERSVLIVSHDIAEVLSLADEVVVVAGRPAGVRLRLRPGDDDAAGRILRALRDDAPARDGSA
jgi:ABC-type nitrate/sulfonate/bicarbonate transport system ATPase subunit